MMNRFAQPLYGKIIYIYETHLEMKDLSAIFSPSTYWIDVTGIDCEVGYTIDFIEGGGLVFRPHQTKELTFEETKAAKIEMFKLNRDTDETAIIVYKDKAFDYDDKARERMRIAESNMINKNMASQLWMCADNTPTVLTVQDFKEINSLAADRSNALHIKYNELKAQVNECVTAEKLEAIIW